MGGRFNDNGDMIDMNGKIIKTKAELSIGRHIPGAAGELAPGEPGYIPTSKDTNPDATEAQRAQEAKQQSAYEAHHHEGATT